MTDSAEKAFQDGLEAERRGEKAVAWDRFAEALRLEPDNPEYLTATGRIAARLGRKDDAEAALGRALAVQEAKCGPDHPDVAAALRNLASLYEDQDRDEEAVRLYLRSLAILEEALGPEHPDIAETLVDLGYRYQNLDRPDEAEGVYLRALSIREAGLGVEHDAVDKILDLLGEIYDWKDRYDKTEAQYRRILNSREKAFGPDHKSVIRILRVLANLFGDQGRADEAVKLHECVIASVTKIKGIESYEVERAYSHLASMYQWKHNDGEAAETLYRRFLKGREQALCHDHPLIAEVLLPLAEICQHNGRAADAIANYERALAILETAYGPDDLRVCAVLAPLATLYREHGRRREAAALYWRVYEIRKHKFWIGHDRIPLTLLELMSFGGEAADFNAVEAQFKQHIEAREKQYGGDHPEMAESLERFAELYEIAERGGKAWALRKRAKEIKDGK